MDKTEIEQVIREVKAGNLEKFGVIIDALQKRLFLYCYHMLGHRQEAEDAVQEVFLKAYEQLDQYRDSVSFSAWVYKIAYHHCLNATKRSKLSRMITFLKTGSPTVSHNEGEARVDRDYVSKPLHQALSKLSVKERNILILRVIEEKSYEELSVLLNEKPATLRKQYERAVTKCKSHLGMQKGGDLHDTISAIR